LESAEQQGAPVEPEGLHAVKATSEDDSAARTTGRESPPKLKLLAGKPNLHRMKGRPSGEGFAFRLFLGVALTMLAAGAGSYTLLDARVRADLLDSSEAALQKNVTDFERQAPRDRSGRTALRQFVRTLRTDGRFAVAAAYDDRGYTIAGSPTADGPGVLRMPVRSGQRVYTLVAQPDDRRTAELLSAVRDSMLVLALPAILISLLLFWLLAGRTLHARHRFALERATRDGLTGLGNHRAFQDELRKAVALAERSNLEVSLAVFDLDDFKFLNDRRGHQHGDEMLRRVADVLAKSRIQDRPFRTGGDEFALLMAATGEYDGYSAAIRIHRLMNEAGVACSVGISATRPEMRSAAVLREEAEAALHEGKRRRSHAPVKFSDVRGRATILTPEKIHRVRLLISDRAIDVALQPIWDLEEARLLGLEALARPHSDYGLTGPADAFDVAEQIGRIGDLDRLCVERILERASDIPAGVKLFVNIHPSSLDDGEDGDWLLNALRAAGVRPDQVVVEVTERSGARVASLVRSVARLRAMGLKVALDDVGAGNAGLEMLHSVAVDYVKVDRAIVARAPHEQSARAALAAVAAFAHETGTFVIAEGIEDAEALEFVRTLQVNTPAGIRGGQGYGLGRPASSVAEATAGGPALLRTEMPPLLDDATLDAIVSRRDQRSLPEHEPGVQSGA
jgi:diguanylate cyclase (GGDEF)-like protein